MAKLYTDGSCLGNPGCGGIGAVLVEDDNNWISINKGFKHTTNNRMELLAVIEGLGYVDDGESVTVISDSVYVVNTINKGWKRRKNTDLWKLLDAELDRVNAVFEWVKGHNGDKWNEYADSIAQAASRNSTIYYYDLPEQSCLV